MWFLLFGLFSCGETKDDSGLEESNLDTNNTEETTDDTAEIPVEAKEATQVFRAPERPWDLALSTDGRIFCSTQRGNKVYIWDPSTEERIELGPSVPDVQNIWLDENDTLYFTNTDNGVTGTLSVLEGNQTTTLYTQADDGTLMRWPMDFVQPAPNEWIIADYQQGLFVIDSNGSVTTRESGTSKPQGLLWKDGTLYVVGEDGTYSIQWPNGTPQQLDARSGLALVEFNGAIWSSNASIGVFEVGGPALGLTQAARPGSLLRASDGVYFADHVGEGVWLYSPDAN